MAYQSVAPARYWNEQRRKDVALFAVLASAILCIAIHPALVFFPDLAHYSERGGVGAVFRQGLGLYLVVALAAVHPLRIVSWYRDRRRAPFLRLIEQAYVSTGAVQVDQATNNFDLAALGADVVLADAGKQESMMVVFPDFIAERAAAYELREPRRRQRQYSTLGEIVFDTESAP